jgi:uncharacterized protein (DUF305 family)
VQLGTSERFIRRGGPEVKRNRTRLRAAALIALAVVAACSRATTPGPAREAPRPLAGVRPPAPAAVEFMTGMIHHHAQAIEMAALAPTNGASVSVRTLAERITVSQRDEIEMMSWWLRDNGQPVPEPSARGMRMVMDGVEHEMLMPGMLTPEQMAQLGQARGTEFDRLFLTFMIQHHQGALEMVDKVFNSYGGTADDNVYKFASDVFADQDAEIDRMTQMLAAIAGSGGPR